MEKEKTITVKHFLNKRLKPKVINNLTYYPSYCQITYKRHNTQFLFDWVYYQDVEYGIEFKPFTDRFTEEGFNVFVKEHANSIRGVNTSIKRVIKFEEKKYKNRFSLKGFSKRFDLYGDCFSCDFNAWVLNRLMNVLKEELKMDDYERLREWLFWFGFVEGIKHIEKCYINELNEKIGADLWTCIETNLLLLSFIEKYKGAQAYGPWIIQDGFEKFSTYLKNKTYSRSSLNPFKKELAKISLKEDSIYIDIIRSFINGKMKRIIPSN